MYSCSGEKEKQTVNYSLLVRFHVDDLVDNTSVDVSEENVVVVVTKAADSQREWAWFEAGVNSQSTQVYLLYTMLCCVFPRDSLHFHQVHQICIIMILNHKRPCVKLLQVYIAKIYFN